MNPKHESETEAMQRAMASMAVESWRLSKAFLRVLGKFDANEQGRYINQLNWFNKKSNETLEQVGLKMVIIEGQAFDTGMAATPLNMDEFAPDDELVVDQMIEPIIMGKNGVVKMGTMTLKKV